MSISPDRQQRVEDCRELYLKYGGEQHEQIEREMRALGHRDFHRRSMYRRFERGRSEAGWIERFGWQRLLAPKPIPVTTDTLICEENEASCPLSNDSAVQTPQDFSLNFDDFVAWLKHVSPGMKWEFKHQVYIYKRLRKVLDGDLNRLMIFMPPRHGKSELVTKHFAAYWLKQNPSERIIIGCYNQTLANKFSKSIRRVLMQDAFLEEEARRNAEMREQSSDPSFETNEAREFSYRNGDPQKNESCRFPRPGSLSENASGLLLSDRMTNTAAEWETREGGGVRAVGVGAGITGYGANLIIIDDPVKSRAEANSAAYRDRVYDWFNDDLTTRLEPDGKIILIQTRWHEDDLAGRLLREMHDGGQQWEVISLPALAESEIENGKLKMENEDQMSPEGTKIIAQGKAAGRHPGYVAKCDPDPEGVGRSTNSLATLQGAGDVGIYPGVTLAPLDHPNLLSLSPSATGDPLNRRPGQALWPERFNEEALQKLKRQLGSYSFGALYQQTPVPAEGGLFKRTWFKTVPSLPPGLRKKRGWDFAISKNTDADYTASAVVAYDRDGNMYIYDVIRRRIEYPEQRRLILGRIKAEPDTEHGIETSANGNAVIQDLRKEKSVRGSAIRGVKPQGDKITRALPWIALAEEGRVFLVHGPWNQEFIDEACSFPLGTHDDQIDAVSIAVRMCRSHSKKAYGF